MGTTVGAVRREIVFREIRDALTVEFTDRANTILRKHIIYGMENPIRNNWIDTLLRGTLEIPLPTLSLTKGNQTFLGSGRLSWKVGARVRVQAATEKSNATWGDFLNAPAAGTLTPHSMYISVAGKNQGGWDVQTIPARGGPEIDMELPHLIWEFESPGLSLSKPSTSEERMLRVLFGASPEWTRGTETEVKNEFFGDSWAELDWLLVECSIGRVAARRRSPEWFEARVMFNEKASASDGLEVVNAISRAFGFLLGRRVLVQGHEDDSKGIATKTLRETAKPTSNTLLEPLGTGMAYSSGAELLLGKLIDFFLTDHGKSVASHLYLCWDTLDNALPTRLAVASICVEGLLGIVSPGRNDQPTDEVLRGAAILKEWLDSNPEGLTQPMNARIRGFIGQLKQKRAIDVLRDWQTREILGVTKDDVDAWKKTRDLSAHAKLITPASDREELQSRMSRLHRIQSLMNRIVLQLAGYRGRYVDYSRDGWPDADFPFCSPESL